MVLHLRRISSVAVVTAPLLMIGVSASVAEQAANGHQQAANSQQMIRGLTVTPVRVTMPSGQTTTVLTIDNNTGQTIGFQVRPFAWSEPGGADQFAPTDVMAVSPPIGTIQNGGRQIVRLVLRQPGQGEQEGAYRILFDQVPPPPQPGKVNFAYRFSIPIFVESAATRNSGARVNWSLQSDGGNYYLVATNSGARHDAFHNIALNSSRGAIAVDQSGSPYVLPGAMRRWRIVSNGFSPSGQTLRVTASADSGVPVDQPLASP